MRRRMNVEPGLFRVEVWFDEASQSFQIKRTDPIGERQHLTCTFEEWEQIKYAVDHVFEPAERSFDFSPELRDVVSASRN
jgi:hypothetical protein